MHRSGTEQLTGIDCARSGTEQLTGIDCARYGTEQLTGIDCAQIWYRTANRDRLCTDLVLNS